MGSSAEELKKAITGLNAKGKTPITASLSEAGKFLAQKETKTTVVLISDGLETCKEDPCAKAKDLKSKGIKFVVHVVGFDVDQKAADQLNCIASAGGGRYFKADNTQELSAALGKVQQAVADDKELKEPEPAPLAPKAPQVKSKSKRIRLAGPGTVVLKPASWVKMPPYYWLLADPETGRQKVRAKETSVKVKQGDYQPVWRQTQHGHSDVFLSQILSVKSGETVELPIDTGLRLTLPQGVKTPYFWGLSEPGSRKMLFQFKQNLDPQVVPAGTYTLWWRQSQHGSRMADLGQIEVEAGKLNDHVLESGISVMPADWVGKEPNFYLLKTRDNKIVGQWRSFGPQLVGPGKYILSYRGTQHHNNTIDWGEVEVPASGFAEVPLNSGIKFLHEENAKPPYRIILINLKTNRQVIARETWEPLVAPPGKYRLDWWGSQHGGKRTTLADEIAIEPGVLLEVEM
jgi:Ca-activated chloride channel family protein